MMRVLIIGGYGQFGFRLGQLLSGHDTLEITLAGRSLAKAQKACEDLARAKARYVPLALDRNKDLATQIIKPFNIIVDTSGPFQAYGDDRYRIAEHAISIGAHYFDIADGAQFVAGIETLDARAKAAKVSVISGLSTYPCLTAAVAADLSKGMAKVTGISAGIAPSPHAVMGRGVIGSILDSGAQKIDGDTYGLSDPQWEVVGVPGEVPLIPLLFSTVSAPEAELLPRDYPSLKTMRNSAGPQPVILHRMLIFMAWMSRKRLLPPLRFFETLIYKTQAITRIGEHRSGMFVRVDGTDKAGRLASKKWGVIAIGDDGPNIPILPIVHIIEQLLRGDKIAPGARSAIGALSLADYQAQCDKLNIISGTYDLSTPNRDVYPTVIGPAYSRLPAPIQGMHRTGARAEFSGRATITRGRNPLSHIVGGVFRFPKAKADAPIKVTFTREGERELWTRNFGGHIMTSTQEAGTGKDAHMVIERFGPVAIIMAAVIKEDRLYIVPRRWRIFGASMPRWLLPHGDIFESVQEGRFHFHVEIKAPLLGLLVKYQGWLERA